MRARVSIQRPLSDVPPVVLLDHTHPDVAGSTPVRAATTQVFVDPDDPYGRVQRKALAAASSPPYSVVSPSTPGVVVSRQPLSPLVPLMSWANRTNGLLMVLTGIFGLFSAVTHPAPEQSSSALLSMYVGGGGSLLLLYDWGHSLERTSPLYKASCSLAMRQAVGFMDSHLGRAAFLLLVANLSWTCGPLGVWSAVLTNANALFFAYVGHASFVEGQHISSRSSFASGGVDQDGSTSSSLV